MTFNTDYSDVSEGGGIIPEGEYECIIKWAGEDSTTKGTVYFGATLVLRNDVDQPYKNKYLFYKIWHKKEPSPADIQCSGYSSKQVNTLCKSSGIPANMNFESFADLGDALQNKVVKATVEHESYEGKTREKVKWVNESKFPQCNHVWKKADPDITEDDEDIPPQTAQQTEPIKVPSDDDLPF